MSYFHLLPSSVITMGYNRALLFDTQHFRTRLLSLTVAAALMTFSGKKTGMLQKHLLEKGMSADGFKQLMSLLQEEGFVLCTAVRLDLTNIGYDFRQPHAITNCIIDISPENRSMLGQIAAAFSDIVCPYLQIRVCHDMPIEEPLLEFILEMAAIDTVNGIEIIMPWFQEHKAWLHRTRSIPTFRSFVFYGAEEDASTTDELRRQILYRTMQLVFPGCCGIVDTAYFNFSIDHVTESQQYNTCLNRKISIDGAGNIKNCPSMSKSYGNISETGLQQVFVQEEFKRYGYISKDQVEGCRDCEFRHVCTDCRAYLENPDNDYSKPLKCGYDPYSCVWKTWSAHPMKQKTIAGYGL